LLSAIPLVRQVISRAATMPENIRLQVIPKPIEIPVIFSENAPAFTGKNGGFNYLCGFCDAILAEDVEKNQYSNKIVKCYECWRFNKFS
jgi:hypothetical protein